jgi:4-aminobutyrate aminotransferase-like enzyme/Ser/Thr protein kinase RdoA (MazF antagonist)
LQPSPDTTPRFSAAQAEQAAAELFGLSGSARALDSERDQNFELSGGAAGRFVLKVANADEDIAVLELQNAALRHVRAAVPGVEVPGVIAARNGREISVVRAGDGRTYFVRLVSWLEGTVLAERRPRSAKLLASLGRVLGQLDDGLRAFQHPAMHRPLYWDLRHIDTALRHLPLLSADEQTLVTHFRAQWDAVPWQQLRSSVIHGDVNDYNVLVRGERVCGIIDFGDMVHSALVGDLAIAVAYVMLDESDPLAAAVSVTRAYNECLPLTAAEVAALYPLVLARLCMSACYAAYNARAKQEDPYQLVHAQAVWQLLRALRQLPQGSVAAALREACGPQARLLAARTRLLGGNLSLSYQEPLNIVRGSMQYLYDERGRRYLDAYNNVPHVGHCHPAVVRAAAEQMALLNTNTRYLNEQVTAFAQELGARLPGALKVCYFVNSGSEANELALRLARAHTAQRDLIVLQQAYHGNSTTLVDISPYKQDTEVAPTTPSWVHIAPLPDGYRGPFKAADPGCGSRYAAAIDDIIAALPSGTRLCGFIAESWPSVGGQLQLPPGYLPAVYRSVRAAGGVCIADEVQTAYGRLGEHCFGFEAYGVVPDIVVLGKPIGNGHPLGAVVTTADIAASFDNGIEFFSTFGGNTVSCAVGRQVLRVLTEEGLQAHAAAVGSRLLQGLRALQSRHALIGDVRGSGFFLGVELVRDRASLAPASAECAAVINQLRREGVLIGSEGEHHNVLKIRPPLPFNAQDADLLLQVLDHALSR